MVFGMTVAVVLHRAAGHPQVSGFVEAPGVCKICGRRAVRTQAFSRWLPSTATDWETWHAIATEDRVCEPCVWVRSGRPGQANCLRLQSHVWRADTGWARLDRHDVPAVRAALLGCLAAATPWAAAVATDGKKHAVIYAALNQPGYAAPIVGAPGEAAVLHSVDGAEWGALRLADEAARVGLGPRWICGGGAVLAKVSAQVVRDLDRQLRALRGTAELELAARLRAV